MSDRVQRPLLAALACAGGFGFVLVLAYLLGPTERLDLRALDGFATLRSYDSVPVAEVFAKTGDPLPLLGLMAGVCALGLLWQRPWHVGAAVCVVAASSIASQLLKLALAHPRAQPAFGGNIEAAAFPSGHASVVMALAIALVLVVPRRLQPAAAIVGALYVLAVSLSIVVLGWHYPSDVVGGMLLGAGLGFCALAGLRRWAPAEPGRLARRGSSQVGAVEFVLICAATFGVVLAISEGGDAVAYAREQTAAAATAVGVAMASAALLSAFAALARD